MKRAGPFVATAVAIAIASYLLGLLLAASSDEARFIIGGLCGVLAAGLAFLSVEYE